MACQQEHNHITHGKLKQHQVKHVAVSPIYKMSYPVYQTHGEKGDDQRPECHRALCCRNEAHNQPNASAFNQRSKAGYCSLLAEIVQLQIIVNQTVKKGSTAQQPHKESRRPAPKIAKTVSQRAYFGPTNVSIFLAFLNQLLVFLGFGELLDHFLDLLRLALWASRTASSFAPGWRRAGPPPQWASGSLSLRQI